MGQRKTFPKKYKNEVIIALLIILISSIIALAAVLFRIYNVVTIV